MESVQPPSAQSPENVPPLSPSTQEFVEKAKVLNIILDSLKNLLLNLEAAKRGASQKLGTPKT